MVLGLTATPPEALTADQALLVDELFGAPLYRASIPAVVKVGDLAPYVELAWLTTPTPQENDWLKEEASRFQELITQLTAPAFGSMPFLQWLDARFVATTVPWFNLLKEQPEVCRAVLRLHHTGLLRLPPGARMAEEHRTKPTADDWCLLIDDWLQGHLTKTGKPEDEQVVEAVRRALPSVGYQWTKRGIRRGRSPVDRVLARSESKTAAVVAIVGAEHRNLGEGLRMLVLCDHERAGATLPADLTGVLDQQSGSAHAMLGALVEGAETGPLAPMLVTGKTVAGAPGTLLAFQQWLPDRALAEKLRVEPLAGSTTMSSLVGPWESRDWVGLVTTYFQDGHCKVLVGTRALLGEGWDARRITGLADVTAVTTITSVVQTRGRALRTDPLWPEKVAVNWSLVCVTDTHPKGGNDWDRLVRKHAGFLGLDVEGQIIDGVAHLDPLFSPFVPPPVAEFEAANARALVRSEQRALIREQWQVGQPYADATVPTIRIKERGQPGQAGFGLGKEAAEVVLRPDAAELRGIRKHAVRDRATSLVAGAAVVAGLAAFLTGGVAVLAGAVVVGGLAATARVRSHLSRGRELTKAAETAPSVVRIASAVADGLLGAGLTRRGSDSVEVVVDHEGEYRCLLRDVDATEAGLFVEALEEAVAPIGLPRYLVPRWVRTKRIRKGALGRWTERWSAVLAGFGRIRSDGVVYHAVPDRAGRQRRARRGVREGLGPLGRRRRARLHRLARGPGDPRRQPGHRPVRREHGDAEAVGLTPRSERGGSALGVVGRAPPVHDDDRLVADDPGVVALGEGGDVTRDRVELAAVGHLDPEGALDVVLEVRRLAEVGARDRLDVVGPAPAGLQREPADLAVADVEQLDQAVLEGAGLVGAAEVLLLGGCRGGAHVCLLVGAGTRTSRASAESRLRRLQRACRCPVAAGCKVVARPGEDGSA